MKKNILETRMKIIALYTPVVSLENLNLCSNIFYPVPPPNSISFIKKIILNFAGNCHVRTQNDYRSELKNPELFYGR